MMLSFRVMNGSRAEHQAFKSGFTFIELLVTLAVVAIMLAMTVPGFQAMLTGNAIASLSNEFVAALHLTRSEAIKRGTRVTLCKSANSTAPVPVCGGSDWQDGWIIFVDSSAPLGQFNVSEVIIQRHEALPEDVTLTATAGTVTDYVSNIESGALRQAGGAIQSGAFSLSRQGSNRTISLIGTGRVSLQ